MIPLKWIFNTYIHTLIGLLQDTSVAACGGLQSRAQPLHVSLPLAGYLDRRGKHPPVSPPQSPLPPSKYKFYFTPPSTIRTTPLQSFLHFSWSRSSSPLGLFPSVQFSWSILPAVCSSNKADSPPPEAFFLCSPGTFHLTSLCWHFQLPFPLSLLLSLWPQRHHFLSIFSLFFPLFLQIPFH